MTDPVLVYRWTQWDPDSETLEPSLGYATPELIRSGLGVVIHTSALRVERMDLEDGGFYGPKEKRQRA